MRQISSGKLAPASRIGIAIVFAIIRATDDVGAAFETMAGGTLSFPPEPFLALCLRTQSALPCSGLARNGRAFDFFRSAFVFTAMLASPKLLYGLGCNGAITGVVPGSRRVVAQLRALNARFMLSRAQ